MNSEKRTREAGEAFARDTKDHEMAVLHDDGLYRHLRFTRMTEQEDETRKPSPYWFELVTWPGCLAVNGDMGSYVFSRLPDMFEFFRGHEPNQSYWAEKLCGVRQVREYDEEHFRQHILDDVKDAVEAGTAPDGLSEAVREQVLDADGTTWEQGARRILDDFAYLPPDAEPGAEPWRFTGAWKWDLSEYTHQFLWCCCAIPWGIGVYDLARAAKAVAA